MLSQHKTENWTEGNVELQEEEMQKFDHICGLQWHTLPKIMLVIWVGLKWWKETGD